MKIAIEAQRIFRPNKHGMDFVALETIRELQRLDTQNEYRIYVAPGADVCLHETPNFKIITLKTLLGYPIWEQWCLWKAVRLWSPNILHCTSNTAPMRALPHGTSLIVTLHDIIFLESQSGNSMTIYQKMGRLYRRIVVPTVIKNCRSVITVSKFEKEQIEKALGLCPSKIEVVYNGISPKFRHTPLTSKTGSLYKLPTRYILFLGNTDPKKNTPKTILGYATYLDICQSQGIEPLKLVVGELNRQQLISLLDTQLWNRVQHHLHTTGYIKNDHLVEVYSGAALFLYTSLRESFGIPPLEAMGCQIPVLSSSTSAIPEILGQAAMLVDPRNPNKIGQAIFDLLTNHSLQEAFTLLGSRRFKQYSWTNTAIQTLNIYQTTNEK